MSDSSNGQESLITDAQLNFANLLATFCTVPGTCICFLVLVAYGLVARLKKGRKYLDRVSFRLLVYALLFNVCFGIAFAATPAAPGTGCNLGAFCINLFLCFSAFFTTCIAINLQLVLVHGVNGRRMEKYYLIGTTLLSLAINVPTFALHQFGWDEGSSTCWYKNSNPALRLRWIIGTLSFWTALAATVEMICSCVILVWMCLYHQSIREMKQDVVDAPMSNGSVKVTTKASEPICITSRGRATHITRDPRYRSAIFRIALYPIVSLIVNYSTVSLDLVNTIRGVNTELEFRLLVLDLFFYGMRTLPYGIIAAVDPSFTAAVRELLRKRTSGPDVVASNLEFAPNTSKFARTTVLGDAVQLVHLHLDSVQPSTASQSERETTSIVTREKDNEEEIMEVINVAQDVEIGVQGDYEVEFWELERQQLSFSVMHCAPGVVVSELCVMRLSACRFRPNTRQHPLTQLPWNLMAF